MGMRFSNRRSSVRAGPNCAQSVCLLRERPDLVVVDLTMPEKNGLKVTRLVREGSPTTDVLILTMHFSEEVAREVVRCGARGYLLKSDADIELLHAVRHIQQHKSFFTRKLAMSMAESFVRDTGARNDNSNNDAPLSARELEVVQLLASGKSNKEAAAMIGVSHARWKATATTSCEKWISTASAT
jgi:DNA-binding NarL/FixJ family response regulator